jgi:hypothetical protein
MTGKKFWGSHIGNFKNQQTSEYTLKSLLNSSKYIVYLTPKSREKLFMKATVLLHKKSIFFM